MEQVPKIVASTLDHIIQKQATEKYLQGEVFGARMESFAKGETHFPEFEYNETHQKQLDSVLHALMVGSDNRFNIARAMQVLSSDSDVLSFVAGMLKHSEYRLNPEKITEYCKSKFTAIPVNESNIQTGASADANKMLVAESTTQPISNMTFSKRLNDVSSDETDDVKRTKTLQRTLAIIKPNIASKWDEIFGKIEDNGFNIIKFEQQHWFPEKAVAFYKEHEGRPYFDRLVEVMCQGPLWVLIIEKENAIASWRELIGPTSAKVAKETKPNCFRAIYGDPSEVCLNGFHGSDSVAAFEAEENLLFPK